VGKWHQNTPHDKTWGKAYDLGLRGGDPENVCKHAGEEKLVGDHSIGLHKGITT